LALPFKKHSNNQHTLFLQTAQKPRIFKKYVAFCFKKNFLKRSNMRKIVAVGVMLFSVFAITEAQVQYGVKGGFSSATIDDEFKETSGMQREVNSVQGFSGGVFAAITLPALPFALQPELLYVRKGTQVIPENGNPFESFAVTTTLDYIELPVLAKFYVPVTGPVSPNAFIGAAYSYLLKSEDRVTSQNRTPAIDSTASPVPHIEKNDLGFVFGIGADFNLLATKITLDARHTMSLINVFKKQSDTSPDLTFKNRTWLVMLGVAF
jgi:hypothetical protein